MRIKKIVEGAKPMRGNWQSKKNRLCLKNHLRLRQKIEKKLKLIYWEAIQMNYLQ